MRNIRELGLPLDRVESPLVPMQGVTPQETMAVVMKGKIAGKQPCRCTPKAPSRRQLGEWSGAKMTPALIWACATTRKAYDQP